MGHSRRFLWASPLPRPELSRDRLAGPQPLVPAAAAAAVPKPVRPPHPVPIQMISAPSIQSSLGTDQATASQEGSAEAGNSGEARQHGECVCFDRTGAANGQTTPLHSRRFFKSSFGHSQRKTSPDQVPVHAPAKLTHHQRLLHMSTRLALASTPLPVIIQAKNQRKWLLNGGRRRATSAGDGRGARGGRAGPQARRDAGPQARRDAGPQARRDAGQQARRDAGPQARRDAATSTARRRATSTARRRPRAGERGHKHGETPGHKHGETPGRSTARRRATSTARRRAQARRDAGPQARRDAGPQARRDAGPQARRDAGCCRTFGA